MKDQEKKITNKEIFENKQKRVKKIIDPKHQQEQEELFAKSDAISPANKKIDNEEIIRTIGGEEIDLSRYIEENYISVRSTHYFKSFYLALADLFNVDPVVMEKFVKPVFVPVFKNYFILGRFPQKVQNRLKAKNKYIGYYRRKYYFYQLITKEADLKYRTFIKDAEEMAVTHKGNFKKFIIAYCTQYKLPIQMDLFDNFI